MDTSLKLNRPGGRIAYELHGDSGPLVVCIPGIGDLRSTFDGVATRLAAEGYRVARMDLRGHGDSDNTFARYDDVAAGEDALALVEHLGGGPALLVGNSMGAGAAAWAAAERPDQVAGIALLAPFVRDGDRGRLAVLAFRLMLTRPWGPRAWDWWFSRSHVTRPAGLDARLRAVHDALARPGRWQAFAATTHTNHAPVEARLGEIKAPALVVMGEKDPDWPDPAEEAETIAGLIADTSVTLVPDVGHYPQVERPDVVEPLLADFVGQVFARA
ncbi:MAG TPA: alpha/beta hydrolase [Jiangellales bacterium]|nr:alpha/beta hydrolase [Jiangellales bacterium]